MIDNFLNLRKKEFEPETGTLIKRPTKPNVIGIIAISVFTKYRIAPPHIIIKLFLKLKFHLASIIPHIRKAQPTNIPFLVNRNILS